MFSCEFCEYVTSVLKLLVRRYVKQSFIRPILGVQTKVKFYTFDYFTRLISHTWIFMATKM